MLEAAYWFALLSQEAPARREAKRVIQRWCLEGERPLSALFSLSEGELREQLALSERQVRRLLAAGARAPQAEATLRALTAQGVGLVTRDDLRYPEALPQRLPEEWLPYYFFFKGELALLTEPGMALLGGETSPPAGEELACALGAILAGGGFPLIGGYAQGLERLVLDAVLKEGGRAILVLPAGIERYQSLLEELAGGLEEGRILILSPYPPAAGYREAFARARRFLVAALAEAILLVGPTFGPEEWPWLERFLSLGGRAFVWKEPPSAQLPKWLDAGAEPLEDVPQLERLVAGWLGVPPSEESAPAAPLEEEATLPPLGAAEALEILGRAGRLPPALAQRLEQLARQEEKETDSSLHKGEQ